MLLGLCLQRVSHLKVIYTCLPQFIKTVIKVFLPIYEWINAIQQLLLQIISSQWMFSLFSYLFRLQNEVFPCYLCSPRTIIKVIGFHFVQNFSCKNRSDILCHMWNQESTCLLVFLLKKVWTLILYLWTIFVNQMYPFMWNLPTWWCL